MATYGRLAVALFFVYIVWGTSYAAIQACLVEIPVFALTASRLLVAGTVLAMFARRLNEPLFSLREFLGAAAVGLVLIWATSTALALGLAGFDSGLSSVVLASVPIVSAIGGLLFGQRFSWLHWVGSLIGLIGLFGILQIGETKNHGMWWVIAAAFSAAIGALLGQILPAPRGLVSTSYVQFLVAGLAAALSSWLFGESLMIPSMKVTFIWAYFTLAVTLGGYIAFFWLLRQHGLFAANSYAYVNPVVAMLLSAFMTSKFPGPLEMIASFLVLAGAALALIGNLPPQSSRS